MMSFVGFKRYDVTSHAAEHRSFGGAAPSAGRGPIYTQSFGKTVTWRIYLQFKTSLLGFNNDFSPSSFAGIVLVLPAGVTINHVISPTVNINNILLPAGITHHILIFSAF